MKIYMSELQPDNYAKAMVEAARECAQPCTVVAPVAGEIVELRIARDECADDPIEDWDGDGRIYRTARYPMLPGELRPELEAQRDAPKSLWVDVWPVRAWASLREQQDGTLRVREVYPQADERNGIAWYPDQCAMGAINERAAKCRTVAEVWRMLEGFINGCLQAHNEWVIGNAWYFAWSVQGECAGDCCRFFGPIDDEYFLADAEHSAPTL